MLNINLLKLIIVGTRDQIVVRIQQVAEIKRSVAKISVQVDVDLIHIRRGTIIRYYSDS